MPTTDPLDETAASMFSNVLRRSGVECEVVSAVYFAGEVLDILAEGDFDVVCVSHVPPPSLPPIRYLCKRLLQKYGEMPVIVGAWRSAGSANKMDLGLPREGNFYVASTLAEAQTHAQHLDQDVRVKRLAASAPRKGKKKPAGLEGIVDVPSASA